MSRLTRDGTAETVSRDQILRHERGQGNANFPCSADHEQDRQPYPVGSYSCYMCVTIHTWVFSILVLIHVFWYIIIERHEFYTTSSYCFKKNQLDLLSYRYYMMYYY